MAFWKSAHAPPRSAPAGSGAPGSVQSLSYARVSRFRTILPRQEDADFHEATNRLVCILKKCAKEADRTGVFPPTAILFSENSMGYVFSIKTDDVMKYADAMQKLVRPDLPLAVAFSVLEQSPSGPRNAGYLLNGVRIQRTLKRVCTNYDHWHLMKVFHFEEAEFHKENWDAQGDQMQAQGIAFPTLYVGGGLSVELRVCYDITVEPIRMEPDVITLVPAFGLNPHIETLCAHRKSVIINDGNYHLSHVGALPSNMIYGHSSTFRRLDETILDGEISAFSSD
ncbi:MAG: hypothetical protein V1728_05550 [Candidatus Micrarchaeota archaeon]